MQNLLSGCYDIQNNDIHHNDIIMAFSIMTHSIMTLSIMTFSIMTLRRKGLFGTLSINDFQDEWHSAYSISSVIMLNVSIYFMLC